MTPEGLRRAAEHIGSARHLVVSTGAGMSKESGIPTFRDAQEGLWARFDPEELATEAGFRAAPARVWSWYSYRRTRMGACRPHAGHEALVHLEQRVPEVTLVTQNIDGLHQTAGSREVIELHGSIRRNRCLECRELGGDFEHVASSDEEVEPPLCGVCGGYLRPDVVWFGEMLPEQATRRAWAAASACDVLLVVGTSGLVWPAAELPHLAKRQGATVLEINPAPSELTPLADVYLQGPAGEVLPQLLTAIDSLPG
jgi:NAD-dependent deacetylase